MLVRPIDFARNPRRALAYIRREAGWLRDFAASLEHREIAVRAPATAEATDRLFGRLDPDDVAAVEQELSSEEAATLAASTPDDRKRLLLALGLHHGVPGVAEKTGLSPAQPPETVHAMGRGAVSTGGSYYYADIVADAVRGAGGSLAGDGLDFGCSSGRVVRVLGAAFPEVRWHGCDPQAEAIAWAGAHLPGIDFFVSHEDPPLPQDDGALDLVFAISIWSHYGEGAARRWLDEMHRVIRPGGHLLLTFHGYTSIAHYVASDGHTRRDSVKAVGDLYRRGFWFHQPFDEDTGDHGIRNDQWGTAFMTTEWLLDQVVPEWSVVGYGAGRAEGNQDLIVLRRR